MPRDQAENRELEALGDDNLSAEGASERRAVHPYRDRRDALIERRRALGRELSEIERAVEKREHLSRQLAVIDGELDQGPPPGLDAITISTPCRARWEAMRGDDVVRRCGTCDRDVYDIARMTRDEVERLLSRAAVMPCVRLRRRRDGRVVTADCPVQPSLASRAARAVATHVLFGASAAGVASLAWSSMGAPPEPIPMVAALPSSVPPVEREPALPLSLGGDEAIAEDSYFQMGEPVIEPPIAEEDLGRYIRWLAPQAWEIDRELVTRGTTAPIAGLRGPVRFIPHEENGRVVGVKVYGVRRTRLLGLLGIQNGDLLIDLNGHSFASPDGALEAYARLRDADALFLRLERRGEERVHVYRVTR